MKKTGLITAMVTLGLLIASNLPVDASAARFLPPPVPSVDAIVNLPAGQSIRDKAEADVTGDGVADKIYLSGHKNSINSRYTDDLRITVISGADKVVRTYSLDKVGGYRMRLFVGDFSGDKVSDVYVEAESGGSGGWSYHKIVSFSGDAPREIFGDSQNRSQSVTGKFIDGFKVELTNSVNSKIIAIDVSDRRKDYLRLGIFDEAGIVIKETQTMTAPFSRLEPIDADNDGVFELKGIQRISGAYRADGIADVETILKYDGTVWNVRSVIVAVNMNSAQ